MHNILYKNGILECELLKVANLYKPFHSRVDKVSRKASLKKLLLSPDDTRNSSQIKRFLVPTNKRYAYKMHATYRGNIKCHNIYDTNSNINRILRISIIKTIMENVDEFPDLKKDLLKIIRTVCKSWKFDCVITDIPWLKRKVGLPVITPKWSLVKYNIDAHYGKAINILLKKYKKIPLNILPVECYENLPIDYTTINNIKYKCPLVVMKSNSYYSGYITNSLNRGLPTTVFKII